jgi:hypothetical protein
VYSLIVHFGVSNLPNFTVRSTVLIWKDVYNLLVCKFVSYVFLVSTLLLGI